MAAALAEEPEGEAIDEVVERTATAFEESRVLSIVPAVLDELNVKQLVPILREVETRDDKDVRDYLLLSRLYRRLDEPEKAVTALNEALSIEPDNAQLRLEYAYALLEEGEIDAARVSAREGVLLDDQRIRVSTAYAAAIGWPWPFLGGGLGLIWAAGLLAGRRHRGLSSWLGRVDGLAGRRHILPGLAALVSVSLGLQFLLTGHKVAFLLLATWGIGSALWLALDPFRVPVSRALRFAGGSLARLATGRLGAPLSRLSPGTQVLLLLGSAFFLVSFAPFIDNADLRIVALFLGGMLFFSTLGGIILRLLGRSASLKRSLRWLALGGTLPFLVFFIYAERESLRAALSSAEMLGAGAADRLVGYLVVWGVGALLALLLAGIISRSILDPVRSILGTVESVRAGDLQARTDVDRRDEVGTLAAAVDDMAIGLEERRRIESTFRQYVDGAVAEHLIAGDTLVSEARRVPAVILFSDVRGFTSMSERLEPEDVVRLLNAVFSRIAPLVRANGGVVDKFLGDGMMAVWGVPQPLRVGPLVGIPSAELACRAALAMVAEMEDLNVELAAGDLPQLSIGIGINAGEVVAGPIGSSDRKEYTVIGDAVNTAQRAESQARDEVVLTGAVVDALGERIEAVEREPVALKGKSEPVRLYTLTRLRR